ncbi:hypothetical protein BGZ61DRAFT_542372 [Ilyonectria robusta]|uniref:uncharacterized protein n=1 Tax=Ilyonectria robusta TaxID=1079257 RepID=UPI001E8DFBF4|nr:uncharacterized protein BGZ61DRAFT_542372 [Ilyonectria robusta]KAH8648847.1 hypothetical protein BGZ61DRAFT_542372 [Ilyonectria robusta]
MAPGLLGIASNITTVMANMGVPSHCIREEASAEGHAPAFVVDSGPGLRQRRANGPGRRNPARAVRIRDLPVIQEYATAAKNAVNLAGFDGVEIHGANGYLVDQFTQDTSNKRTDAWGGSIKNRSRFALEVTKAVVDAVGTDRVGIRLSSFSPCQGMKMADPVPQFSYLVEKLKEHSLGFLHLVESRISGNVDIEATEKLDFAVKIWGRTSPIVLAGGFKPDSAKMAVDQEHKDYDIIIAFGRYFIANPDLPFPDPEGDSAHPVRPHDLLHS